MRGDGILDHGEVVADSMRIVSWLEKRRPDPPLWPASLGAPSRGRRLPRVVQQGLEGPAQRDGGRAGRRPSPTSSACTTSATSCAAGCTCSRRCSSGRDWLMGEAFGAADVCAFPFLKYGVLDLRPDDTRPLPPGARRAPADLAAPSPRSRPGCTASTPSRALELILRAHLGRVEKACRYCLGERTSQVHLLPEADERPAQAGRSLYQDRRTARASGPLVVLRAGGPTQIHLCWPAASVPREERAG